ncbi:MAG: alpha-E domain-containing protein, partial [Gammaproteobacteria bacterium]
MLSRVAERLYWMARYLERAEDTARLTSAYAHL